MAGTPSGFECSVHGDRKATTSTAMGVSGASTGGAVDMPGMSDAAHARLTVTHVDALTSHVEGRGYRAVDPSHLGSALAGSRSAGRYSRPTTPTLYLGWLVNSTNIRR